MSPRALPLRLNDPIHNKTWTAFKDVHKKDPLSRSCSIEFLTLKIYGYRMTIEEKYQAAWKKKSGPEKIKRVFDLYDFQIQVLKKQRLREAPSLDKKSLRIAIAKHLYLSDPNISKLLEAL